MGKDRSKKASKDDGVSKFDGFGVDFKCKLIGIMDVSAARGDDICQDAMTKLSAIALKNNKEKKEHKQKITVNITFKGIRLLDEASERIDYAHPIHRISFISHDENDKRTFGYIVGTREGYKLFAIKAMKEAEQITKTLKELFQEVFERHQAQKNKENAEPEEVNGTEVSSSQDGKVEETGEDTAKELDDPFLVDWGQLNEQIQVMQQDGMSRSDTTDMFSDDLFLGRHDDPYNDITSKSSLQQLSSDPFNPFDDNTTNANKTDTSIDFFATPKTTSVTTTKLAGNPSSDLFNIAAPAPPVRSAPEPEDSTSLLMNDPFADLKKNINELHKQNQMQQQFAQRPGFNPQPSAFHAQPTPFQPNPYVGATNPFGMQPAYGVNQMRVHMQPPVMQPPAAGPNPFYSNSSQQQQTVQTDMGWTITKPAVSQQTEIRKPNLLSGTDPFAFLDNQTGSNPTQKSQPLSSNTANNDIFDLLG